MSSPTGYVLGHTDLERRRLALQASIINPLTENFLRRAGVSAGMRVLELGCGIGEVSLIAARLVGPHGHLHCIDFDAAAIEVARGRARSAGHDHVAFEQTEVSQHVPTRAYDAVIGRHILIHVPDAPAVLRQAVAMVHLGGLIAFHGTPFKHLLNAKLKLLHSPVFTLYRFNRSEEHSTRLFGCKLRRFDGIPRAIELRPQC
jgi:2-polyprenyl-3-methyl-5-hydroxy-6-metoxy-1,4-benzoquinol methylase